MGIAIFALGGEGGKMFGGKHAGSVTRLSIAILALFATVAFSGFAHAVAISNTDYELAVTLGGVFQPAFGAGTNTTSFCDAGTGGGCQSSTATMTEPFMEITGTQSCAPGFASCPQATAASASAIITYWYAVIDAADPTNTTIRVPLLITANISTQVSGTPGTSTGVTGLVAWTTFNGTVDTIKGCSTLATTVCNFAPNSDASVTNSPFDVQSNVQESITLRLDGGTGQVGSSSFTGIIDPLIEIDPIFLENNPGFSLEFGANVPPDTIAIAAPEPSTIGLFATGLIAFGFMRRRMSR
jgi:hypothetical protein